MPAAERKKRAKPAPLAGVRVLVSFAVVLGAALAAVFPTRSEYADIAAGGPPNAYSLAYLKVLTRADPRDIHLRLLYARQLATLGEWEEALQTIEPALADPLRGGEAIDLRFDVLLARARAIPEGKPARKLAFHAAASALDQMAGRPERRDKLAAYAQVALELDEPGLAARLFETAADADSVHRADWLEQGARWHRAAGDEVAASRAYERASRATSDAARAEDDAMLALDCLQAADRAGDAFALARDESERFADRRTLDRAIVLASAAGRVSDARDLGRKLLASSPDDPDMLLAQARRELAAGDPARAVPLLERVKAQRPDDGTVRELEAHAAEWSGHPEVALDDWLWLLARGRPLPESAH